MSRYRFGHDGSFDRAANWLYDGMSKAFAANTARLAIVGDDPMLLSSEDPAKVARASKANSIAYKPALERIVTFDINWNIVAYPSPSWAKQVFPDDEEDVAVAKLADAIFAASRVDKDGAVEAWNKHNATLRSADRMAEWPALQRAEIFRARHRSDDRARRRPRMGGRRFDREQRHHLQRQYPDRGSFHDAACAAGRRPCRQLQAAVLSGLADRQYRGQVRGRPHRRGQGPRKARKC